MDLNKLIILKDKLKREDKEILQEAIVFIYNRKNLARITTKAKRFKIQQNIRLKGLKENCHLYVRDKPNYYLNVLNNGYLKT